MKEKAALLHKIPFRGEFSWWGSGKESRICSKLENLFSPEGLMGAKRKDCRWAQCGHPSVDNEWETCTVVYTERKTLKSVMKGQMKKESVIIQQNIKDSSGPSFLLRRQVTISLPWNHSRNDRLVGSENWCLRHFWLQCFKLSLILRSSHPNMKPCNEHRELPRAKSAPSSYFLKSKPKRKYHLSGACQTLCIHCTFKKGMHLGWAWAQLKTWSLFWTTSKPCESPLWWRFISFWIIRKMFHTCFIASLVE